jgi:hypothetical protein
MVDNRGYTRGGSGHIRALPPRNTFPRRGRQRFAGLGAHLRQRKTIDVDRAQIPDRHF